MLVLPTPGLGCPKETPMNVRQRLDRIDRLEREAEAGRGCSNADLMFLLDEYREQTTKMLVAWAEYELLQAAPAVARETR